MAESVRTLYVRKKGSAKWAKHVADIGRLWRQIRTRIEGMHLEYAKVRLYQDGLPNCGREAEIVADLARAGSRNHLLLADLMARGATIMGTESPELLLEEYNLARETLAASGRGDPHGASPRQVDLGKAILQRRDRYIAQRVAETLQTGETGLIFLGMLHTLAGLLPPDIEVIR
jgi:sulfur transfer complex TusBCD TusB component (DsrH family)